MSARGLERLHDLPTSSPQTSPSAPQPLRALRSSPRGAAHLLSLRPAALPRLHVPGTRQSGLHLSRASEALLTTVQVPGAHGVCYVLHRPHHPGNPAHLLPVCGPPPARRDTQGSRACLPSPRRARLCVSEQSPARAKLFYTRALTLGHLRGLAPWEAKGQSFPHSLRKTGARTEGQELTGPEAAGAAPWTAAGLPGNGAGVILEDLLLPAPSV